ncbi:MAG TPA: zinc ribbon domain-containing protein [Gemmatimonadaceae bacterium]
MQNVDRMFLHLVHTVRARFPNLLSQPFEVGELAQTVLPYRHHRRDLGLDTNDDYELTLVQLLASDYLIVDDQVRDAMRAELAAPNPDPGAFRRFAHSQIAISPNAIRALESGTSGAETSKGSTHAPSTAPASAPASAEARAAEVHSPPPPTQPSPMAAARATGGQPLRTPISSVRTEAQRTPNRGVIPAAGELCRFCDNALPVGRAITYCPHCGQNLTTMGCPACGSELEVGWRYCPSCGRQAATQ